MFSKKNLFYILTFVFSIISLKAAEPAASYKLYGFIRSDLYYNSRQNQEALDGLFNMFPKPIDIDASGKDKNAVPNSQMLAISSRLGIDFIGTPILGAKSSGKIECDFAGVKDYYYLVRLRQAYLKLNWAKTELLVGQAWHPMFSNLQPITPALSVATPFQPFNRSPQIRLNQKLNDNFTFITVASYQMQFMTQGPAGASASYMKNGLIPGLHIGLDYKSKSIVAGVGVDGKSLKINNVRFNSGAAVAYAGYTNKKFQVRVKSVLGQNMSEYLTIGGYGVSGINTSTGEDVYTNINTTTSWLSVAYGTKIQVGIYGGLSQNLGSNKDLLTKAGKFTAYGNGFYNNINNLQLQMDQLYRVAPHITYNLSNFRLGFEYELTTAKYGEIQANGKIQNPYNISNHRAMTTISYFF
jgi:hypothetical protein